MRSPLRLFGAITVLILWTGVMIGIYRAKLNVFGTLPLSSLGVNSRSAVWFSGSLLMAALTLILFSLYLKSNYQLNRGFWVALIIGQTGQIIAAIVPYGGNQPARFVHTLAAMTLAFSIPVMIYFFASSQKLPTVRRRAFILFWIQLTCFIVGIGSFVFLLKGAPACQILPAVAFHAWLIYFSFYRPPINASEILS